MKKGFRSAYNERWTIKMNCLEKWKNYRFKKEFVINLKSFEQTWKKNYRDLLGEQFLEPAKINWKLLPNKRSFQKHFCFLTERNRWKINDKTNKLGRLQRMNEQNEKGQTCPSLLLYCQFPLILGLKTTTEPTPWPSRVCTTRLWREWWMRSRGYLQRSDKARYWLGR